VALQGLYEEEDSSAPHIPESASMGPSTYEIPSTPHMPASSSRDLTIPARQSLKRRKYMYEGSAEKSETAVKARKIEEEALSPTEKKDVPVKINTAVKARMIGEEPLSPTEEKDVPVKMNTGISVLVVTTLSAEAQRLYRKICLHICPFVIM